MHPNRLTRFLTAGLFVFLPTLTFAQTPGKLQDVEQRVKTVLSSCFERDWREVKCELRSAQTETHDYSEEGIGGDTGTEREAKALVKAADFLRDLEGYILGMNTAGFTNPQEQAERVYSEFTDKIETYQSQKGLSECHRACLATCLSSLSVTYDETTPRVQGDPADILFNGRGVCTQYAYLGQGVMETLGLETAVVISQPAGSKTGHSYVRVRVDRKWYYVEPQSDQCLFMKRTKQ